MVKVEAKKPRKFYGVSSDKWYLGSKVSKNDFENSEKKFMEIENAGEDLNMMFDCLDEGREYLQLMFRQEDPSTHMVKVKQFWKMPYGPSLLSEYFEWLVDSSTDGKLSTSIEDNLDPVIEMTVKILGEKKGTSWMNKLDEVKRDCEAKQGNDIMKKVFVIRELAKYWRNAPEKLVFIEGEDDLQKVSNQPHLSILKVNHHGENNEEGIVISVKVGHTTVFENVDLCVGLAAVIQLCFTFHLMYPSDADDIFNYVQRVLAKFGPSEGAKNSKGQVKKKFVDFQCAIANVVLNERKGVVKKMFV